MNIDFKLIKEKYPNAYQKFFEFAIDFLNKFPEESCYCDLFLFFDKETKIIIEIQQLSGFFYFSIKAYSIRTLHSNNFKTRQEAKEQAIIKSFEILEGEIK